MARTMTAETLFQSLRRMPEMERERFFGLLCASAFRGEDLSHEELFWHLAGDEFTAKEAAEYLGVSMSTFRRFVASGRFHPSSTVGRNQMFAVPELKAFKKALKMARG